MLKKGLLPEHGKIMMFATSGGGILVEQYLEKYGHNVTRALIESSCGVDVARKHGRTIFSVLTDRFKSENTELYRKLEQIVENGRVNRKLFTYMIQRPPFFNLAGESVSIDLINEVAAGRLWKYRRNLLKPPQNFYFVDYMCHLPVSIATRVRIYEVFSEDLFTYWQGSFSTINLMYEWAQNMVSDFLEAQKQGLIQPFKLDLSASRKKYGGEFMIMYGDKEHTISWEVAKITASEYPESAFALFHEVHLMEEPANVDLYRSLRRTFFQEGLNSQKFRDLMNDSRQLNKD
ncbi:MAG: hypothetical protein PHQ23_13405 [Candidatus Wallbacteria bacterium]|nr:hypothetical protein [Candidatus Wallbacteria bacterium]